MKTLISKPLSLLFVAILLISCGTQDYGANSTAPIPVVEERKEVVPVPITQDEWIVPVTLNRGAAVTVTRGSTNLSVVKRANIVESDDCAADMVCVTGNYIGETQLLSLIQYDDLFKVESRDGTTIVSFVGDSRLLLSADTIELPATIKFESCASKTILIAQIISGSGHMDTGNRSGCFGDRVQPGDISIGAISLSPEIQFDTSVQEGITKPNVGYTEIPIDRLFTINANEERNPQICLSPAVCFGDPAFDKEVVAGRKLNQRKDFSTFVGRMESVGLVNLFEVQMVILEVRQRFEGFTNRQGVPNCYLGRTDNLWRPMWMDTWFESAPAPPLALDLRLTSSETLSVVDNKIGALRSEREAVAAGLVTAVYGVGQLLNSSEGGWVGDIRFDFVPLKSQIRQPVTAQIFCGWPGGPHNGPRSWLVEAGSAEIELQGLSLDGALGLGLVDFPLLEGGLRSFQESLSNREAAQDLVNSPTIRRGENREETVHRIESLCGGCPLPLSLRDPQDL
jgi:hypothetical protein